MGPFLLVDKSFIQSLNSDEARVLHRHYSIIITPIFLQETLGDIAKSNFSPDESLRRVIILAQKADQSRTISDARGLCLASLLGAQISLRTQIPRFDGTEVKGSNGSKGIIFEETFEQALLRRWRSGDFTEDDKVQAAKIRRDIDGFNPQTNQEEIIKNFPENTNLKASVRFLMDILLLNLNPFLYGRE